MCISVSLSGFVVLGCLFAPKVHIVLFQPQKNVVTHRLHLNRFSVSGTATTYSQCKYGTKHEFIRKWPRMGSQDSRAQQSMPVPVMNLRSVLISSNMNIKLGCISD